MDLYKIGKTEAIALFVVIILNHLVLNLPKVFFETAGSAAWLNALYVFLLAFIFIIIILKLFKNFKGMDILDVSKFLGGNSLKIIIGILFLVYLLIISSSLLRDLCRSLNIIYFKNIPTSLLLLVFLIVASIANHIGNNVIVKITTIITSIVLLNLGITFFLGTFHADINNIFPILGNGAKEVFLSGSSNIFAFSGIVVLYFIMPMLKDPSEFNKIGIWGIVISGIYLILGVLSLLLSFSNAVGIYDFSPIYLIVRSTQIGKFLQRPESLFMFFWILSLMTYISVIIMLCCTIFKKISKTTKAKPLAYFFASIIFSLALAPENIAQVKFIEDTVYKYYSITLLFFISGVILILANIKHHRKNMKLEGPKPDEN